MSLRDEYVTALEAENETLLERIAVLEEQLGMRLEAPLVLGLTGQETRIFGMLLKRDILTKDAGMLTLYGHRNAGEEAEPKIVDVFVCKMRKKLAPFGITIETHWGAGWSMPAEAKAIARALLPRQESEAAA